MSHDQLFKDLLRGFFYEFLTLFLPEIAAGVDPESIEFMDVQDFTDRPEGGYRVADLVARVRYRDEPPRLVIVHTEVESEPDGRFPYRLWEYNALLTLRHGPPVVPIGLLPFAVGQGVELATYTEEAFGRTYRRMDYWRISLRGLPAAEYLEGGPALGAALAALMRPPPGGKVELKAAIFARLRRGDLAPGTRALFFKFVQTYLELDEAEHADFARRMAPEGDVTMETLEKTWLDREIERGVTGNAPWVDRMIERGIAEHAPWADRLVEQGIEQGIEQGTLQGKREAVRRVVRVRFGMESAELDARLTGLDGPALDVLFDRAVVVPDLTTLLT